MTQQATTIDVETYTPDEIRQAYKELVDDYGLEQLDADDADLLINRLWRNRRAAMTAGQMTVATVEEGRQG